MGGGGGGGGGAGGRWGGGGVAELRVSRFGLAVSR